MLSFCSRFEPCPGPVSQWCQAENQLAPVPSCFFMAPPFHSRGLDISSSSPVIALGHHGAGPSDLLCVFPGCHWRPCRAANSAVLPRCHSATLPLCHAAGSAPISWLVASVICWSAFFASGTFPAAGRRRVPFRRAVASVGIVY